MSLVSKLSNVQCSNVFLAVVREISNRANTRAEPYPSAPFPKNRVRAATFALQTNRHHRFHILAVGATIHRVNWTRHFAIALTKRYLPSALTTGTAPLIATSTTHWISTTAFKCAFNAMIQRLALELTIFLEPPVS